MLLTPISLGLFALASLVGPSPQKSHTQDIAGRLDKQDETLSGGEFVEVHYFEVTELGPVTVRLTGDFDGYLIVQPPDFATTKKGQLDNDDWEGNLTESRIEIAKAQTGRWKVAVTTASKGVGGNYSLSIVLPGPDPNSGTRTETKNGKLSTDDAKLGNGEYFDRYEYSLKPGEQIVVTMESGAFDTFLALATAAGESLVQNDDFEGSTSISRIEYTPESEADLTSTLQTLFPSGGL